MSNYKPGIDSDRRKRAPDTLAQALSFLSGFCWLLLFFCVLLLDQAQPKLLSAETEWNEQLLSALYYLMLIVFGFSLTGIMMNRKRHRRKGDFYRISLVLSLVISLIGLILLLFR
ncbi:MAG: hypothetical protein PHP44_14340 [Kiritimatiellae bacterium]|nr:hypothetical protein [Kiritimatiellia bacterium]MDD4737272.1 hypothetical protein [Kiritimatiellia bacterium]